MAQRTDVNRIVTAIAAQITEENITHICVSTPNDFDIEAVITTLSLKEKKITAAEIVKVIKATPKPKPESCQKCWSPFGIPVLDVYIHRETQNEKPREYEWLAIPTVYAPCPNCSGSKRYLELYARQREDERAWTWILLYDYFIFNLQQSVAPEAFTPAEYWPGVEGGVAFSPHQRSILIKIYESSKCRENNITHPEVIITRLVQSVVKPMVMQDTIPF